MIPSNPTLFLKQKVVVFVETRPLSDHFEQIMLSPEQFKKFSKFFANLLPKQDDGKAFIVTTNDEEAYDFPNIRDMYDEKEIADEA